MGIDSASQGRSQVMEDSNDHSLPVITSNSFNITQIKMEQSKDPDIQWKINETKQDPTKHPDVFKRRM